MQNALIKIFKFICYCLCLTSLQINLWSLLILIGEIFFVFFWHATHRIFIPRPRIKPISPSVKVWSPNHRTTREIPEGCYFYGPNRCFLNSVNEDCKTEDGLNFKSESRSVMSSSLWPHALYTIHGILQARILEWVAFLFSRGSSQPRDQTQVSHIAGKFLTIWATREAKNTGVGSLSLLQGIFLTLESNRGSLHTGRFFNFSKSEVGLKFCMSNKLPDDAEHGVFSSVSTVDHGTKEVAISRPLICSCVCFLLCHRNGVRINDLTPEQNDYRIHVPTLAFFNLCAPYASCFQPVVHSVYKLSIKV